MGPGSQQLMASLSTFQTSKKHISEEAGGTVGVTFFSLPMQCANIIATVLYFDPPSNCKTVSVFGREEGYTVKYTPMPEGVVKGDAQGNS